jgi:hypothetical protein
MMIDLTGKKFGRLTVLKKAFSGANGMHWHCECKCGAKVIVLGSHLRRQLGTRSCGCWKREKTARRMRKFRAQCKPENQPRLRHGHFTDKIMSRTYQSWHMMIQRCTNPKRKDFDRYGGRGVTVCKRWREDFEKFLVDMGERPEGRTLDRKNTDGSYTKRNCRWATPLQQEQNKRVRS